MVTLGYGLGYAEGPKLVTLGYALGYAVFAVFYDVLFCSFGVAVVLMPLRSVSCLLSVMSLLPIIVLSLSNGGSHC